MKKSIKNIAVLVCICAVVSVLLAVTNALTAPLIAENEAKKANEALLNVMPEGKSFTKMDISTYTLPATVKEAYRAENGGYVIRLQTTGYSSGFVIMCGIMPDGTVSGAVCLASTETLGYEKTFGDHFKGKNSETVDSVDTVSGATKTTGAYRAAIKDALNAAIILGGGEVDIRTEEEILRDHLSAALPEADGEFEKLFLTEMLDGADAVYTAKNGFGFVCVIGENFVGLDANGTVMSGVSEELSAIASAAIEKILASETFDIALSDYEDLPSALIFAKKTATGNYVMELRGAGYGILGGNEYHPASGEYIVIRVSMTGDGTIIDCLTVSEEETDGLGSACAEEWFYGQFIGKTEENYQNVDAISRATITTNGYKEAIENAFICVKIFEGGAEN